MRFIAAVMIFVWPALAADSADEKAALATVQRLFDAMASRDVKAAEAVLTPDGRYSSVRENGAISGATHAAFIERLGTGKEKMLERMIGPKVLIQGRVATVWTPYTFHRDGKFSHCGVDSFHLLKTPEGWKIAGFIYTVETTGCPDR